MLQTGEQVNEAQVVNIRPLPFKVTLGVKGQLLANFDIDKFRFGVFHEDKLISSVWFMDNHGDDIYLGVRGLSGKYKLSLHQSGVCQFAITSPHWNNLQSNNLDLPEDRTFARWKRQSTPEKGAILAAFITFPSAFLTQETEIPEFKKPLYLLESAPPGQAVVVRLLFHAESPSELEGQLAQIGLPIISLQLPSGEHLSIVARHEAFDPKHLAILAQAGNLKMLSINSPSPGEQISDLKAHIHNRPTDGEALHIIEVSGLVLKNNSTENTQ